MRLQANSFEDSEEDAKFRDVMAEKLLKGHMNTSPVVERAFRTVPRLRCRWRWRTTPTSTGKCCPSGGLQGQPNQQPHALNDTDSTADVFDRFLG